MARTSKRKSKRKSTKRKSLEVEPSEFNNEMKMDNWRETFEQLGEEQHEREKFFLEKKPKIFSVYSYGKKVDEVEGYLVKKKDVNNKYRYYYVNPEGKMKRLGKNNYLRVISWGIFFRDVHKDLF